MIGVPYFYGGVAKINSDWLQGMPLGIWLSDDTDFPIIGQFFEQDWMILFMSYSGMLLDLLIVPALLFKRTRLPGFLIIMSFHLMNAQLFTIGIFPWFMIGATTLYFNSSWPRNLYNALRPSTKQWKLVYANEQLEAPSHLDKRQLIMVSLVTAWVFFQCAVPLRHFFIPGNPNWTEEGHRYSWHMKLRTKRALSVYKVVNKETGEVITTIDPQERLESWQSRKMGRPYLVHRFCRMLAEEFKQNGLEVEIYPTVISTLNGRKYQDLIRGDIDLVNEPFPASVPAKWIVPLETPLSDRLDDYVNEN